MVTSYHRNGPAEFTKLLSARAPTPRRRRVGPIGGYVSSHRRMDGLNPVAWRQHHDRGAHVGFDCLVFVNPSGARLQRFTSVALNTQRALCEQSSVRPFIDISKIPCKAFKNSLLRCVGNLAVSLWIHLLNGDENWRMSRKSSKIPCKFPASREFEVGDRSDQDCVVSQPVRSLRCDFQVWENRRHSRGLAGNGRVFGEENRALPTEGGVFLDESLLHEFSISGI